MNLINMISGFWKSKAPEAIGEVEDFIHHPVYLIKHYTAVVARNLLYRGSWPDLDTLRELHEKHGVQSVINLCSERRQDAMVRRAGMRSLNVPMEDNTVPLPIDVGAFRGLVRTVENLPVFIHCEQGVGRTGCMVAVWRVMEEGWTPKAALAEARAYGLRLPSQQQFILRLPNVCQSDGDEWVKGQTRTGLLPLK